MITETTPLNQWPLESLVKLSAMLQVNKENGFIPEQNIEWYENLLDAINKAIQDKSFEATLIQF